MRRPLRILCLAGLLTALLTASGMLPSASADPDPTPEPTATSSPSPSPTTEPSPAPEPTETPTPSPSPTEEPDPTPSPSPTSSPDGEGKGQDEGKQSGETGQRDRKKSRKDRFVLRGPQNTAKLVSILTGVLGTGMSLQEALLRVVGPFPVAGLAWWSDDWHAPRCCPYAHLHQGLDMFAPIGTPLVAAADGYVSQMVNSPGTSGLGLEITDRRNIQYFYAHLSAFEPGIEVGTQVKMGQVVGYVGDTGNARGTTPHVHFEYQPDGIPGPPKPHVDRWLKMAERKALELVREVTGKTPKVDRLSFRLTRLFDLVDSERTDLIQGVHGDAGNLLTLAGLNPATNYQMALETAGTMAWEIDWGDEAAGEIALRMEAYRQEMAQQTLMGVLQDPSGERAGAPAQTAGSIIELDGLLGTEWGGAAGNPSGSGIPETAMVPEALMDVFEGYPPPMSSTVPEVSSVPMTQRASVSAESKAGTSWPDSFRAAAGSILSGMLHHWGLPLALLRAWEAR